MRLFVGIGLDDGVRASAGAVIAELKARAARFAPGARVTWIKPERLHITVRFLGNVPEERIDGLQQVLAPQLDLSPFSLSISGVGTFPPKGPPRVVWAAIADGGTALAALEQEVTTRLRGVGFPPEDRPFRPHLTLARVKDARNLGSGRLLEGLQDRALGTTQVSAITLFESRLSPGGSEYVALQHTSLSG